MLATTQHHTEHRGPEGCVLIPLLFPLLTHDCTTTYSTNHIVKFAHVTALVVGNKTHYRREVNLLTT